MCVYSVQQLPERTSQAADGESWSLPTAFALLEAELAMHALPVARAPQLAEVVEEKESVEAA